MPDRLAPLVVLVSEGEDAEDEKKDEKEGASLEEDGIVRVKPFHCQGP